MNQNRFLTKKERYFFKSKKLLFAPWAAEDKFYTSYQYWYSPFKKIFSNFIFFDPQKNLKKYGKDEMNKKFLKIVEKEKPDYIFMWIIYHEFYPHILIKIREISPKTKTIIFLGDDAMQFESFSIYYSLIFDFCLVLPQPNQHYEKYKIKKVFYTCGTNLENFKFLNLKKRYNVTFIGTLKVDRLEFIKYLKEKNISLKLFGWGWNTHSEFKDLYYGPLDNKGLVEVANKSKINLCFTKNYYGENVLVGRVFEIGACGSFLLVEYGDIYHRFFKKNKEIVMFRDKEELLKKIRYYLKHEKEREKIAQRAYKKIIKKYDLDLELANFFRKVRKEDKNFKHQPLPKMNKKIVEINEEDFLSQEELKEKIKNADYICFRKGDAEFLPYKNYLQAYSLEKTGKEISCCDYYAYSKSLGDYLLFDSKTAFIKIKKDDFSKLMNINQLMVRKEFFSKNFKKFRELFKAPVNIIKKENTVFISIPLVRINEVKVLNFFTMNTSFHMVFLDKLYCLVFQRKLLSSLYPYKLFLFSLLGKSFILKYLWKFLNKKRMSSLLGAYRSDFEKDD